MTKKAPAVWHVVRFTFLGYEKRFMQYVERVCLNAQQVNELKVVGPIPLRNRRTRIPLMRSPFKHKKSQEIVEFRRYFRGLIIEGTPEHTTKFVKYVEQTLEPLASVKVHTSKYYEPTNYYTLSTCNAPDVLDEVVME
eukprot:CAMPEP_0177648192 /NCGR_PEP_ID=MMETSP0447-20121125/10700_1 /TAXON_ID=0 /ORGANISM="Stygamoeba regulata, Strain BSH-02190019" /LENGTH=137 /DNA_ID=CAMNT_0019150823 /DNA_START=79 /DNA_END=492 /DNA_ORIENTATION=+